MRTVLAVVAADLAQRRRRPAVWVLSGLVACLAWAMVSGQVLIKLDSHRGVLDSAWVGALGAVTGSFLLGLVGFSLVRGQIQQDRERPVWEVLASSPLSIPGYLVGRWLSASTLLAGFLLLLGAGAAVLQVVAGEDRSVQLGAILVPLAVVALPTLLFAAACAVLAEAVPALAGGLGTLAWFVVFLGLFLAGTFLPGLGFLDPTGLTFVAAEMRSAATAAIPGYTGGFTFSLASSPSLSTFRYPGITWSWAVVGARLAWVAVALAVVGVAAAGFRWSGARTRAPEAAPAPSGPQPARTPQPAVVPAARPWRALPTLVRIELASLARAVRWYWFAGAAALWLASVLAPASVSRLAFATLSLFPVLLLARLGCRDTATRTREIVAGVASPERITLARFLAATILQGLLGSGVLLQRAISGTPLDLASWTAGTVLVPAVALALGRASRSSLPFQAVFPMWWYLGPLNPEDGLSAIDYLGLHEAAWVQVAPGLVLAASGCAVMAVLLLEARAPRPLLGARAGHGPDLPLAPARPAEAE